METYFLQRSCAFVCKSRFPFRMRAIFFIEFLFRLSTSTSNQVTFHHSSFNFVVALTCIVFFSFPTKSEFPSSLVRYIAALLPIEFTWLRGFFQARTHTKCKAIHSSLARLAFYGILFAWLVFLCHWQCVYICCVRTIGCGNTISKSIREKSPMNVYQNALSRIYIWPREKRIIPITSEWQVSNNHMDLCTAIAPVSESYIQTNERMKNPTKRERKQIKNIGDWNKFVILLTLNCNCMESQ